MSLSRQHNNLFRDAFFHDPFFSGHQHHRNPFNELWYNPSNSGLTGRRLAVDITEQDNTYLVETEVPGFKKDNIDIKIGDGGRSLTVSGKQVQQGTSTPGADGQESQVISNERPSWQESSTFSRTLWLPRAVDPSKVSAKLEDGVLRVRLPKSEGEGTVSIQVD